MCMCAYVRDYVCSHVCKCLLRSKEGIGPLGAGRTLDSSSMSVMDNELAGPRKNK